jgi:MFS family permease
MGFFLTPMSSAHGWGRDVFALALAIQMLLWGAAQPFAGAMADRFGAAPVLSVGAVLYAFGLTAMAYTGTPAMLHLSAGADAIRMANESHYGLAAYVWSHDIGRALRAAHAIEAGWVQVNQGLGQNPDQSCGGYKESGIGREFSLEGMLETTRRGRTSRST